MSVTAFNVDSQTAPSSDLNDVSDDTRMAISLPGTMATTTHTAAEQRQARYIQ